MPQCSARARSIEMAALIKDTLEFRYFDILIGCSSWLKLLLEKKKKLQRSQINTETCSNLNKSAFLGSIQQKLPKNIKHIMSSCKKTLFLKILLLSILREVALEMK